jgi:hypothetical protein
VAKALGILKRAGVGNPKGATGSPPGEVGGEGSG